MRVSELVKQGDFKTFNDPGDKEIKGVYISDMVSDVIANAKAGNLLVTVQVHANVLAAANLVDVAAIILAQGKQPAEDIVRMAAKHEIAIFTTALNRWQVATKLYEIGLR